MRQLIERLERLQEGNESDKGSIKVQNRIKKQGGEWTSQGWVVDGDLDLSKLGLTSLPKIRFVGRDLYCSVNKLKNLVGIAKVGRGLHCDGNKTLKSLKGSPITVPGTFNCQECNLTTLEGGPSYVGGDFECQGNKLKDLKGSPQQVTGDFSCARNAVDFTKDQVEHRVKVHGFISVS